MKKIMSAFAALTMLAGGAQARPGSWQDQRGERFRGARPVSLGEVQIATPRSGYVDAINLSGRPGLECNLTHIKLMAPLENVLITAVEIEYARPDRFGRSTDTIDLNDNDDFGRAFDRRGRGGVGISLQPGEATAWLDLDDVQDGFPDGRCVRSIRIYGPETNPGFDRPGMGRPGWDRNRERGGFDDRCRGPRCPPPAPIRPNRPSVVQVDGLVVPRHGDQDGGGIRPGPRPGPNPSPNPGPGPRPEPRPIPPPNRPPERNLVFEPLGTTGLVSKSRYEVKAVPVGINRGRYDGIQVQAKDDNFEVRSIKVIFGDQSFVVFPGFNLMENDSRYLDFDSVGRGRGDRDRLIDQVIVEGTASNLFGSKAQLLIFGGK